MVACVAEDAGCGGGMDFDVYQYSMDHKIYREEDWPYIARNSECTYDET